MKELEGIDISHYNQYINWNIVKDHISFCIIKATEGTHFVDYLCKVHSANAKKYGIQIGYYHFTRPFGEKNNLIDYATMEAVHFMKTVNSLPKPDLPLALDIEVNNHNLDKNSILLWIKTFFDKIKALGASDIMLYSYKPFLDSNLPANHGLGSIKLWLAQYRPKEKLQLPNGWNEYYIWQYMGSVPGYIGQLNGIAGSVDRNQLNPKYAKKS